MAVRNSRHMFSADLPTVERMLRELEKTERKTVFEKGMLLKHVRDNDLTHGQWGEWLSSFGIDPSTATRYIQVYDQFGNHATSHDLPTSKLFELIRLPTTVDRAQFLATHDIAGMTVKELRELIRSEKGTSVSRKSAQPVEDDSPALDDIPYGTVKRIRQLDAAQRSYFEELTSRLNGGLIADEYEEILADINAGKSVPEIIRKYKKAPEKTPIQSLGLNPYEVLGVHFGESFATVKAKYRTLTRALHPDVGGSEFLFKVVTDAWQKIR